jgi:hypothetical protein
MYAPCNIMSSSIDAVLLLVVFSLYVKEHYAAVKAAHSISRHGDVMTALSTQFKAQKAIVTYNTTTEEKEGGKGEALKEEEEEERDEEDGDNIAS